MLRQRKPSITIAKCAMSPVICRSCHSHFQVRLREHLSLLQSIRRCLLSTSRPIPENTKPGVSLSWYWDTAPPSSSDLTSATTFFQTHPPRKLWTATEWRKQNEPVDGKLTPEVAFLGRSNVGKSSLLNALLLSPKLNHVGARPGKTTTMHAWGLAASDPVTGGALKGHRGDTDVKLAVLDMPGYGHASHTDWGNEIITYLKRRKHLKRAFVLIDALHGIKDSDLKILQLLRRYAISHQIVASKCDRVGKNAPNQIVLKESMQKMRNALQPNEGLNGSAWPGQIIAVGALGDGRRNEDMKVDNMIGIEEVRYAVLVAAGLEASKPKSPILPRLEESKATLQTPLYYDQHAETSLLYPNDYTPATIFSPSSSQSSPDKAHKVSRSGAPSPPDTMRAQFAQRFPPIHRTARIAPRHGGQTGPQPMEQSLLTTSNLASTTGAGGLSTPPRASSAARNIGYGLADLEAMTQPTRGGSRINRSMAQVHLDQSRHRRKSLQNRALKMPLKRKNHENI